MRRRGSHWPLVHAERRALVADLGGLDDEQWSTPSLCEGWTVHDVLAHLVDDATTTPLRFAARLLATGFDFDALNERGVEARRGEEPSETLARYAQLTARRTSAPTAAATRFVEVIVHGEDIRRPLGLVHEYAPDALLAAIAHQRKTPIAMGGGRERAAGRRLVVVDAGPHRDGRRTIGDGPSVTGSAVDVLLWLSGRPVTPEGAE